MSYRRSNEAGVFSSRWRIAHRADLVRCGIPYDVTESDRRWTHALLHGFDPQSKWGSSSLSDQEARELLALLRSHFENSVGIWLAEDLLKRLEKAVR